MAPAHESAAVAARPADAGITSDAERVRLLYRLVPRSSFFTAAMATLSAFTLYGYVPERWLALWFGAAIAIALGRLALYAAYRRNATAATQPNFWENAFATGALLMGLCWAMLPLFGPLSPDRELFVVVVILSLAMSSAGILGASVRSFACFCTPMLAVQVGEGFVRGGALFLSMGVVGLIFAFALLSAYAEFRRALLASIASAAEIRELHRRQRRIFEAANVAVAITQDRIVVDCNEQFAKLLGYERTEMIGASTRIFYPDDASWQLAGEVGRVAMLQGNSARGEIAHRHKSGADITCESSVSSLVPGHPEQGVVSVLHDVTQIRWQETELRAALLRLTAIFDNAPTGIILTRKRVVEESNEFMARLLGYTRTELIGRTTESWFVSTERWQSRGAETYAAFSQGKSYAYEEEFVRKDGRHFWCRVRGGAIDPAEPVDGPAVFVLLDVTERKFAQIALFRSQEKLSLILDASQSGIWDMDMASREVNFSQNFYQMLGYRPTSGAEVLGPILERVHADDRERMQQALYDHIRDRKPIDEIFRLRCKDGSYLWARGHGQAVWNESGRATRFVGSITDMTEIKQQEEKIRQLALHDPLTGLPNRRLLEDRLEQGLTVARRNRTQLAVMLLDLDGFKSVNDNRGHAAGDAVLLAVGERLRACVREADTVARTGGDEFVLLVHDVTSDTDLAALAQKLLDTLSQPIELDGTTCRVGGSIGIAVYPRDSVQPDQLFRMADEAMYRVKDAGRNGHRFYSGFQHAK